MSGVQQVDLRSRFIFKKRNIYPKDIPDWNTNDVDAYPKHAKYVTFTLPSSVYAEDFEVLAEV